MSVVPYSRKEHITVPIPLDDSGRMAYLQVPRDVTASETQRIAHVVRTLGIGTHGIDAIPDTAANSGKQDGGDDA